MDRHPDRVEGSVIGGPQVGIEPTITLHNSAMDIDRSPRRLGKQLRFDATNPICKAKLGPKCRHMLCNARLVDIVHGDDALLDFACKLAGCSVESHIKELFFEGILFLREKGSGWIGFGYAPTFIEDRDDVAGRINLVDEIRVMFRWGRKDHNPWLSLHFAAAISASQVTHRNRSSLSLEGMGLR